MSEFFVVRTVIQTPEYGELVGDWSKQITADQVETGRAALKRNWEDVTYLALSIGDNEIIVPAEMLHRSIIHLEMKHCL